jgi:threonine/homoserine efflux transporter RhtA
VKHGEKLAPVAAVVSAISWMACCLPFGIAAAAGTAGLAFVLDAIRPYLMAASGALILFGVWQLYRRGRSCQRRSPAGIVIFWICAAMVAALMIAPQSVANLLAGPTGGSGQTVAAGMDLAALRADFNRASDRTRLIVLLSPT